MLKIYLQRWGRPLAFYTDQASLFKVNRPANQDEQLRGQEPRTQIGRALGVWGIEGIPAHSPQAKGRGERCFGTLQDRLVKGRGGRVEANWCSGTRPSMLGWKGEARSPT